MFYIYAASTPEEFATLMRVLKESTSVADKVVKPRKYVSNTMRPVHKVKWGQVSETVYTMKKGQVAQIQAHSHKTIRAAAHRYGYKVTVKAAGDENWNVYRTA